MDTARLLDGTARLPAPPALIVVDVDGTLLTTTHEVTPATAREVRRVARAPGSPGATTTTGVAWALQVLVP